MSHPLTRSNFWLVATTAVPSGLPVTRPEGAIVLAMSTWRVGAGVSASAMALLTLMAEQFNVRMAEVPAMPGLLAAQFLETGQPGTLNWATIGLALAICINALLGALLFWFLYRAPLIIRRQAR